MINIKDPSEVIVVGVDVGGKKKGFHAVALRGGTYWQKYQGANSAASLAEWCVGIKASAVGVDAPCGWSKTGRARAAERELMAEGIWCFSTPTLEAARAHPKDYFRWMILGAELFDFLSAKYRLFDDQKRLNELVCFETFPHAVTCAMQGKKTSAKRKRVERRELLRLAGVDTAELTNIDLVDAALCALTAHALLADNYKTYGDVTEGFIVVPAKPLLTDIAR